MAKVRNRTKSRNSIGNSVVAPKREVPRHRVINPKVFLAKFTGLEVVFLEQSEVAVSRQSLFSMKKLVPGVLRASLASPRPEHLAEIVSYLRAKRAPIPNTWQKSYPACEQSEPPSPTLG